MKTEVTAEMLQRLNEELLSLAPPSKQPTPTKSPPPLAWPPSIVQIRQPVPETTTEINKLRSALDVLSPDVLRGQGKLYEPGDQATSDNYWLVVIWGIASLGWTCGEGIARQWSQQSSRYEDQGFEQAWRGYDPSRLDAIGIGSLYRLAIERGWQVPVEAVNKPEANPSRYKILSLAEVQSLPLLNYRVKGILPAVGIAALYGPSGSGKSFLALDLAAAISRGLPWFGHKTYQAAVVYVMLEGEGAIRNRIGALQAAQGQLPDEFGVVLDSFHLTTAQDVADLAAVIPEGAVLFIDTLNRSAPTSDENSSKDMGAILQATKELQATIGGLIVLVHHTGKDASKGMRGHSSLHAALDGAIEVERLATGNRYWSVAKTKDGEDGKKVAFKLRVHVLGTDPDGEEITSCSVEPDHATIFAKPEPKGAQQKGALKTIKAALAAPQAPTGMAGCPAGTKCMKVEDAISAVAASLTTKEANKRRHEARRLITRLTESGFLRSQLDAAEEAWCWIE